MLEVVEKSNFVLDISERNVRTVMVVLLLLLLLWLLGVFWCSMVFHFCEENKLVTILLLIQHFMAQLKTPRENQ